MSQEFDPILGDLWEGAEPAGEVTFDGPYGVGTHRDSVLIDVQTVADHQYGFRLALVFNLRGDSMKYTGRINLPRTVEENGDHDAYERRLKGNERTRNNVAGLLLGADLLGGKVFDVNTEADYEKITSIFRHGIGRKMPIRVKVQQKFNKETEKWENTDFTEIVAIKARK